MYERFARYAASVGEFGDVGSERGIDVSWLDGLISTGADPRSDDISVAAVLQASEQFLQGIRLDVGVFSRQASLAGFRREERTKGIGNRRGATGSDLRNVVVAQRGVDRVVEEAHEKSRVRST